MAHPTRTLTGIRAVSFDATGTLFHPRDLGGDYARLLARHGVEVEPGRAAELVHQVWAELDCSCRPDRDRFLSHPGGARGWWRRFLERFGEHLGRTIGPFAAAELYDHFSGGDAWALYPEVPEVLAALSERGLRLAVISNWDPRLPGVLAGLGIAPHFDTVVYSAAVGAEKPHRAIFERAVSELEIPGDRVLHVGDRRRHDLEGALGAGLKALHLDRTGAAGDLADLRPLGELPADGGGRGLP